MSINFNHVTNDISASSGSVTINGSVPGSGGGSTTLTISNKTAAYTVVAGDLGTVINCTSGTFTVSLTAAATLGAGFNVYIWNTSSTATDTITIDPNAAETIDGLATATLYPGQGIMVVCDGTKWISGNTRRIQFYSENSGPGAFTSLPLASAVGAIAIGARSTSSGARSLALGYLANASSTNATALGVNSSNLGSQAVTGSGAMALGGSYASGTDSFAAAIADNTSTYGATGAGAIAVGNYCASSSTSTVAIGANCTASGAYAVAIGKSCTASGSASVALGTGAKALEYGKMSFAGYNGYGAGAMQTGTVLLTKATTDATSSVLTGSSGAASTTNQVILPNNSAYAFTGIIVARQQAAGGTASAAWKVEGLIRREGTAGTTTLVASTVTAISNVPGWTLALSADTTNGGLAITATGAAATNIRWVATINTSEVTYA